MCQQVNVASLEDVIKHFLKLATDKADAALKEAMASSEKDELAQVINPCGLGFGPFGA